MNKFFTNKVIAIAVIIALVLLDQIAKIIVKTNMTIGDEIPVFGKWFIIHFTENEGMAFGLSFGGVIGKYILTIGRIAVLFFIIMYLLKLLKLDNVPKGVIVGVSLLIAGALGNIIDSVFYGVLFSSSYWGETAKFLSEEGGYSTWLQGHVVDMLYFPVINTHLPSWFPIAPNKHFIFFRPIFNIADAALTCSIAYLFIFQRKFFNTMYSKKKSII